MADAPFVRINEDSKLRISKRGNLLTADANLPAALVIVLSFRSNTRKFRFWTNALVNDSMPGGRIPFCGIRITSKVPMI